MARATFRFYEELNDFLPASRRKREFESECAESATVKQAIEALGIPHTEIEVILVNGVSVDLSHRVSEGDRIGVYPMFEALDVRPLLRLRSEPLRDPRFLADAHLGRLARYLRMLGFDTRVAGADADRDLVATSVAERRILLSRDRELLMHRALTHGVFVRGQRPREQLQYVVARLDLRRDFRPFSRCLACNGELAATGLAQVHDRVPPRVAERHTGYMTCPGCTRVYWRGIHWQRMTRLLEFILES